MKTVRRGKATVLSLGSDDLTNPPRVEAAFDEILSLLARRNIVVDMQGVTRLTSMALSALSAGAELVRERQGSFALAGVSPDVKRLIKRTDGSGLMVIAEDVETALRDIEAKDTEARDAPEADDAPTA
ncbi:MAG: STAS domain-containing protein [Planctomycetota bacterium]|jgi:anti-anti-sigma factor